MPNGGDYRQPDQQPWQGPDQPWPQEQWPPQYGQPQPGQQGGQGGSWQREQYDPGAHRHRLSQSPRQPYPPQAQPRPPQGYQAPQGPPGWEQPGYGQPPPRGPQYAPGPQPPRRGRHVARYVLGAFAGLIVIIVAVVVANSGGHTVQTGGSTATGGGKSAPAKTAGIGSAITLSGNGSGEQMSVTVTKVITSARPGDEISSAPAGDRLYAVQFRLRDTGSTAYSDAPDNSAVVVDSSGQSYQSALDTAAGCASFPGTENIAPGASGLGCVVFEVPAAAKITEVQFTLDSGMGPQTGQWNAG